MTLEVHATGYEVKRLTCQLAGFAGVANRSIRGSLHQCTTTGI